MKHGIHKICLQKWNLAYTKSCLQKWNLAYTKSFCCVWDPLTIALNSTPSKSKSSGAHHSIMFPTNQNRMIYNHDNKIMMNPSSYMNEDQLTYWENNNNMYCRSLLWIEFYFRDPVFNRCQNPLYKLSLIKMSVRKQHLQYINLKNLWFKFAWQKNLMWFNVEYLLLKQVRVSL